LHPNLGIAEINLIGTGGRYGESLLVHLGNNEWIVVDSCINPRTNKILPLELIIEKSIKPEQIKYVICTHWHDDHIKGISKIFEYATDADFVFARANDPKKFFQMLGCDYKKINYYTSNSSTLEFHECIGLLEERNRQPIYAFVDRVIHNTSYLDLPVEIYSLSPSDYSSLKFDEQLSYLMNEFLQSNKKIPYVNPNHRSVALLLKLGQHDVILGSDLQMIKDDNRLGWGHIISSSRTFRGIDTPNYFKIPHHGSENGFIPDLWDNTLSKNATSSMTPWKVGKYELPPQRMVDLYKSYTNDLYITSTPKQSNKPKKRPSKIRKDINQFKANISELRFNYGVVESRIDITNKNSEWTTQIYGTAFKIR